MGLNEILALQREFSEKLDGLCKAPIAMSNEEAVLWQTDHQKYLKVKSENVESIPSIMESDVNDMFMKNRDVYYRFVESWYGMGIENYKIKLIRIKRDKSEISRDEAVKLIKQVKNTDFDVVDIQQKIQDFFNVFEEIIEAINSNEEWFDLYKASYIRGDGLVFNIASLDLFTWQLPSADTRQKNDYKTVAKIMTIYFFIEKIYKSPTMNNNVNPFNKIHDLNKIFSYYSFLKSNSV